MERVWRGPATATPGCRHAGRWGRCLAGDVAADRTGRACLHLRAEEYLDRAAVRWGRSRPDGAAPEPHRRRALRGGVPTVAVPSRNCCRGAATREAATREAATQKRETQESGNPGTRIHQMAVRGADRRRARLQNTCCVGAIRGGEVLDARNSRRNGWMLGPRAPCHDDDGREYEEQHGSGGHERFVAHHSRLPVDSPIRQ